MFAPSPTFVEPLDWGVSKPRFSIDTVPMRVLEWEEDGYKLLEGQPVLSVHDKLDYPGDTGDGLDFYRRDGILYIAVCWDGGARMYIQVDPSDLEELANERS